jgi:hypothetical protein
LKFKFSFLVTIFALTSTLAQANEGHARFDGTLGAGLEQFSVTNPGSGFQITNGTSFKVQGEKPFGNSPFYLTSGISYIQSSGSLNYNYTSPTATYVANNVNFVADDFRLDIGLRIKFFNAEVIRPYIEGGGMAGYLQLSYDASLRTPAVLAAGTDYKTLENVLEFGYYAEAGLELQTGTNWGFRVAYNYLNCTTRNILTFKSQNVSYTGSTYYGGIFWNL